MPTVLHQVGRLCALTIGVHAFFTGCCFLNSACMHDTMFEKHWKFSTPCTATRQTSKFWTKGFYNVLSTEERECLDAWLRCMSIQADDDIIKRVSPHLHLQDSLAFFTGFSELRDGLTVMDAFVYQCVPYVTEIRREHQGATTFLHAKTQLEVLGRVPFTRYTFTIFKGFPSVSMLQLNRVRSRFSDRLVVAAAEHRWFGGRIWSVQTASVSSPWGDCGDLVRRYNAFMLSAFATKKTNFRQKTDEWAAVLAAEQQRLREIQEEEIERAMTMS